MERRAVMFKDEKIKNKTPLVSIVISAYNPAQRFFDKAVDSILSQTLDDWELIICDDCSSAGLSRYIKNFENKDRRIKVIRNRINSGLAVSLNKCIAHSSGEYIARMDDDDISYSSSYDSRSSERSFNPVKSFIISLIIGLVAAFIAVSIMKSSMKSVHKQTGAAVYRKENSLNLRVNDDTYLGVKTEKSPIARANTAPQNRPNVRK